MFVAWLLAHQVALTDVDLTLARRYEGEGFVIEVRGIGRPKGKSIEMWNPDGKLDPALQAAVDQHLSGTMRYPKPAPTGRKDRFIYTRIYYPPHAGAVYAFPDPVGDAQETEFRSVYCNHELVQVHYAPTAKVGTYTVRLYGQPRDRGVAKFAEGAVASVGRSKVHVASLTTVPSASSRPRLTLKVRVDDWKLGDYLAVSFLDRSGKPFMRGTEPLVRAIFPRANHEGTCTFTEDLSSVDSVEFKLQPAINVRFTDVPLDPK